MDSGFQNIFPSKIVTADNITSDNRSKIALFDLPNGIFESFSVVLLKILTSTGISPGLQTDRSGLLVLRTSRESMAANKDAHDNHTLVLVPPQPPPASA